MEISKLILEFIKTLIWPLVTIFIILRFNEELKGFLTKALHSHEVEVDILGQKIKLKALEKLTDEVSDETKALVTEHQSHRNALLTMSLVNMISKLSSEELFVLKKISQEITDKGYCGCEAERLVLEKYTDKKILHRDEFGFYHPTDLGERLLFVLKNL